MAPYRAARSTRRRRRGTRRLALRGITFTVIGGFLGAGKTSLLNRVLGAAGGLRVAVLVNDFGAINIDSALVESAGGPVMQLSNGCICCSLAGGLADAMTAVMAHRENIDLILIEASGISHPARIMDFAHIDPELRPGPVIVLVDADNIAERLADRRLAETITAQLGSADLFVLTKCDIAAPARVAAARRHLADSCPGTPVVAMRADEAWLAGLVTGGVDGTGAGISAGGAETGAGGTGANTQTHRHHNNGEDTPELAHHGFTSVAMVSRDRIDEDAFRQVCRQLTGAILRGKGVLRFESGPAVWQQTGRQIAIEPAGTALADRLGGDASHIVVIAAGRLDDASSTFGALGFRPAPGG